MGSGKSAVGKELSESLGFEFIDTDKLVEDSAGVSIAEIFDKHGEAVFRQMEAEAVEAVSEKDNAVISCGGGAVLNPKNIEHLGKKGIIINLEVSAQSVYERIKNDYSRPLLNSNNSLSEIKRLMKEREKAYQNCDYAVDADNKTPRQIAKEIIKILDDRKINGI